jgi:hypothetical protein
LCGSIEPPSPTSEVPSWKQLEHIEAAARARGQRSKVKVCGFEEGHHRS